MSTSEHPLPFAGEKSIGMVIFTWLWFLVLLDWPFVLAHSKITKTANNIKKTYEEFTHYYPNLPEDPIASYPLLNGLRKGTLATWAFMKDQDYFKDAKQKRRAMVEFCAIMVFFRSLLFIYYIIFRFEGFEVDFWGADSVDVKPVDIPLHWLK